MSSFDDADVRFRMEPGACSGCRIGCAGRCNVFAADGELEITLPRPAGMQLGVGDPVLLRIDEEALRRSAFAGYGLALAGLVGGAVLGVLVSTATGLARDPATLAGLVAGTVWMLRRSKRHRLQPHIEKLAAAPINPH